MAGLGEKPFRARQLMKWIYRRGVGDLDAMTDLGKAFRSRLAEQAEIRVPEIMHRQVSSDGTRKWLLRFEGGQAIEMVFIPEPGRGTLCISSQVGCAMDCTFCSTAQQGFNRNLDVAEITGQVWLANRELGAATGRRPADHQRRLHGHGRAARKLSQRRAGGGADDGRSRLRPVAAAGHGQHFRSRAADDAYRGGDQRRARGVAACTERRAAQRARADQPPPSDRRAARGLLALRRAPECAQRDVRVRDARRRERPSGACPRARVAAARATGQGQPDSIQHVSGHALPALVGGGHRARSATG